MFSATEEHTVVRMLDSGDSQPYLDVVVVAWYKRVKKVWSH